MSKKKNAGTGLPDWTNLKNFESFPAAQGSKTRKKDQKDRVPAAKMNKFLNFSFSFPLVGKRSTWREINIENFSVDALISNRIKSKVHSLSYF